MIELEQVSFRYKGMTAADTLKDINLTIGDNEWVAMIGPNGSGKSTLARIITGLLVPYQGEVHVDGVLLDEETVWPIRRKIGMVFQNPDNQFVGATVEDDVAFGLENNAVPRPEMQQRVEEALKQVRMWDYRHHEPSRLSGGQKQRVALAGVMALRPDVIILDEATSMLDPIGRLEVIEAIRELKERYQLSVISITHDIDEASQADRILVMNQGQLIMEGSPAQLFQLGDDLVDLGLDVPFAKQVLDGLVRQGVSVAKDYMTEEELEAWLISSYLTK